MLLSKIPKLDIQKVLDQPDSDDDDEVEEIGLDNNRT